jgi:hypothetical protein
MNDSHVLAVQKLETMCWVDLYDYIADYTDNEGLVHGRNASVYELRQIVGVDLQEVGADCFLERTEPCPYHARDCA